MEDYNLAPGELVILQEQPVKLGEGPKGDDLSELVLTNQNLILVASSQQGLFRRQRMVKRCPLEQVCRKDDAPQVFVAKYRNNHCLQVAFRDETITLFFPSNPRRLAERWARAIYQAADGNPSDVDSGSLPPSELTGVIDGAKDLMGSIFGSNKTATDQRRGDRPASVTKRCTSCHAPISGRMGAAVTCPYCDTRQTL